MIYGGGGFSVLWVSLGGFWFSVCWWGIVLLFLG